LRVNTRKTSKLTVKFACFLEKSNPKNFGPRIFPYGDDRAEKTAQDESEKTLKKHAHSVLIQPTR